MKLLRNLLIMLVAGLFVVACDKQDNISAADTAKIEQVVHGYLLSHPEILVEVSQKLQAQQQQQMQDVAIDAVKKNSDSIFNDPNSIVIGNPEGNVTLVEFFDYQCVHCAHMFPVVQTLIENNKNLRVVLKEFPIFGPVSQFAAAATLAAAEQGKGAQMHEALFKSGLIEGKMTNAAVLKIAKHVGLNVQKLEKTMKDPIVKKEIEDNFKLAQALSLQGTPAFIVAPTPGTKSNGKVTFVPGASDLKSLQEAIKSAQ